MALIATFLEILRRPTIGDVVMELIVFMVPIWIAVVAGVLVGWAWKPKWANLNADFFDSTPKKGESNKLLTVPQFCASMPSLSSFKLQLPSSISWISDLGLEKDNSSLPSVSSPDYSSTKLEGQISSLVNEDDLRHLHRLVEEKDGGLSWIQMMDKSTPNMSFKAWRRDPVSAPPQYRSRTVYEDASPEMLRDFFWDDEFRLKWDDMIAHAETLEECNTTGAMVVCWVRKFPFFCSDREYIIGRRIWECGRTYYCVTKGVPCSSVPRRDKPRRVDMYYSSWCIRAAESKRDGRMTATEVLLFHQEDMGIPWEIAKLGIRQGMWGSVKKIDPGLRAYHKHRASGAQLSHCVSMAHINTKVSPEFLESEESATSSALQDQTPVTVDKPSGKGIPKMMILGGAIALAYTLDRGLLTKAVIFGVARRFVNNGRRL